MRKGRATNSLCRGDGCGSEDLEIPLCREISVILSVWSGSPVGRFFLLTPLFWRTMKSMGSKLCTDKTGRTGWHFLAIAMHSY